MPSLEFRPVGVIEGGAGLYPFPPLGVHGSGFGFELLCYEAVQQRGIENEYPAGILAEQASPDSTADYFIGGEGDKADAAVRGCDFVFGQRIADAVRLAVPVGEIVEHALLRRMVVGNGKGHHLRQRKSVTPVCRDDH